MIETNVNKERARIHAAITFYLLVIHALLLPFSQLQQTRFTGIATILLIANWLLEGNLKHKLKYVALQQATWYMTGLYLLMLLGMLYTSNLTDGVKLLTVRVPLLLFPLIIFSNTTLDRRQLSYIYKAFMLSVLLAVLLTFRHGFDFLFYEHGILADQKKRLILQRPYFGLYLGLTIYLAMQYYFKATTLSKKLFWLSAAVFFFAFLLILQVKMPIIALLLTIPLAVGLYLLFRKKFKLLLLGTSLFILATILFLHWHDSSRQIIQTVWQGNLLAQGVEDYDWRHSLDARTQIWKFCISIIQEGKIRYTGLGTGDVKSKLREVYCANGDFWCQMQFNPHNQLLDETMRLGLPGLVLLLLMFIYPLAVSIRKKRLSYSLFNIFMFLCMMTESYLNREAGVLFFALFNTLMFYSLLNNVEHRKADKNIKTNLQ